VLPSQCWTESYDVTIRLLDWVIWCYRQITVLSHVTVTVLNWLIWCYRQIIVISHMLPSQCSTETYDVTVRLLNWVIYNRQCWTKLYDIVRLLDWVIWCYRQIVGLIQMMLPLGTGLSQMMSRSGCWTKSYVVTIRVLDWVQWCYR